MRATRFSFSDPGDSVAKQLLTAADGLQINVSKTPDGRILAEFELRGSFGDPDEGDEDACPVLVSDKSRAMVGDLLAVFIGGR